MDVCVIPARGGSKRIPRKNIKNFHGKPIIAYSIEAAVNSGCFDRVIVSTDDDEIASVARSYGAEVPFIRPSNIADDYATTIDVIVHAIEWLEKNKIAVKNVCCIYATAPFLRSTDITQGKRALAQEDVQYSFSATEYSFPIQRAFFINQSNEVEMFQPENALVRSQDLTLAYHDAGQFYWGKKDAFLNRLPFFATHSRPIILPPERVRDIDTESDWHQAELMHSVLSE